jgi:hypothetical protein
MTRLECILAQRKGRAMKTSSYSHTESLEMLSLLSAVVVLSLSSAA